MRHINITATRPIDNQILLKESKKFQNMGKTTSKKILVKASAAKPLGKPPPGDKTLGVYPEIRFYSIEYGENNEGGEEV